MNFDLANLLGGLPPLWAGFLSDWDRSLRAGNYPATTRYNYLLAAVQLARYIDDQRDQVDGERAADTPSEVTRAQVEAFQAWMIQTRSAATALNKHKSLQQFFKWLSLDEEEVDQSPMRRVRQPKTPMKLIPIIGDQDTRKLLDGCRSRTFVDVRDEAIIRMLSNTLTEVDLSLDTVIYHGKGGRDRQVRLGPKTAQAVSRYLRARGRHPGVDLSQVWLAARGAQPLSANGIKLMLHRRGLRAGVSGVHAHRWRHTFAHQWKLAGGDTGDLMLLLGWTSDDMPRHYGASAAAERAQQIHTRIGIGEHV